MWEGRGHLAEKGRASRLAFTWKSVEAPGERRAVGSAGLAVTRGRARVPTDLRARRGSRAAAAQRDLLGGRARRLRAARVSPERLSPPRRPGRARTPRPLSERRRGPSLAERVWACVEQGGKVALLSSDSEIS